ncbi:MAG: FmdB family zinc ribbon protein [Verrucomicrobiota bacterium]
MPTYDYECSVCNYETEVFQSMKDDPLRKCPKCKRLKLVRKIGGGAGLIFKGSGFYETDYKSKKKETKDGGSDSGNKPSEKSGESSAKSSPEKKADSTAKSKDS